MSKSSVQSAEDFYNAVIDTFGNRYPRLIDKNIGMVKVLHAFEDKIPLVKVLLERGLLLGAILKKSSSEVQKPIAQKLQGMLEEHDLLMNRSDTTYAEAAPQLSRRVNQRPFVLGDHGGYYAHVLPSLVSSFGSQLVGLTEHTLNGDEKVLHYFNASAISLSYFSTARIDLKERSDRDIAQAIAGEIVLSSEQLGKSILSSNQNLTVCLVGYGTMGFYAAQELQTLGCNAELIVTDSSAKKQAFAVQDGHLVENNLDDILPRTDILILATNVIKGKDPVLSSQHFARLKPDVCITSMTSLDDETNKDALVKNGIIKQIGMEGNNTVYSGPKNNRFYLMQNGRPANVNLSNGGAGEAIHMVEAAGLAGAFVVGQGDQVSGTLSDEDGEIISELWLKHFQENAYQPCVT